MSQASDVPKAAANATHKLSQVLLRRDGHTMHVSGVLECVYAQQGSAYAVLLSSDALPTPLAGVCYCDTAAGMLAIGDGEIKVHGGTPGTSHRFHDSYAV